MTRTRIYQWFSGALAVVCLVGLACSTDSPSAPRQDPQPPSGGGVGVAYRITITVSPDELRAGSDQPATVNVKVRRIDNNNAPPPGTSMVLSSSLGTFNSMGGSNVVAVTLVQGKTSVLLFPGDIEGVAQILGQLESSFGQGQLVIREAETNLFIAAITPGQGPGNGGTRVTITGLGFEEPLRVLFGDKLATLRSATETKLVVSTPPAGDYPTESCDDDGDGTTGTRTPDLEVSVTIDLSTGESHSLENAFTYLSPNGNACVGD